MFGFYPLDDVSEELIWWGGVCSLWVAAALAQASSGWADLAEATCRTCWSSLWLLLKLKSLKYYLFDLSLEQNSRASLNIKQFTSDRRKHMCK